MDEDMLMDYMAAIVSQLQQMNDKMDEISDKVNWIEFHSSSIDTNTSNI